MFITFFHFNSSLTSPPKTEFRPRAHELACLASNLNLGDSAASRDSDVRDTSSRDTNLRDKDKFSDNYNRYLVLEVYRRDVMDDGMTVVCTGVKTEKVLRMFDEEKGQERYCYLRGDWEMTEVEPGDIVHVTGELSN